MEFKEAPFELYELDGITFKVYTMNGVKFVNASPHELKFDNGLYFEGNVELAKVVKASPIETLVGKIKGAEGQEILLVKTDFVPEMNETIVKLLEWAKKNNVYIISSIISAKAYGLPVISPIVTPETSRLPPAQRIVFSTKFNAYPKE